MNTDNKSNSINQGDVSKRNASDSRGHTEQNNLETDQPRYDKKNQSNDRNRNEMDFEKESDKHSNETREFTKKDSKNYSEESDRT